MLKRERPNNEINVPTAFLFNERGADLFSVRLGRFIPAQNRACSVQRHAQRPGAGQTG